MTTRRLAVCSWSLAPESLDALIDALSRVEIRAIQLALVPVTESPWAWSDVGARLRDSGIGIVSGMLATVGEDYSSLESIAETGGVRRDGTWSATRDRAERVARTAEELGLTLVTLHAGFIPHDPLDPARATLLGRLRALADLFTRHGVRLGLETGQESASTLRSALDELGRPDVGVNFDPANMILYGMGDPVDAVRTLGSRIVQVHIKDARRTTVPGTWGTEVPVGDGDVDWPRFLAAVDTVAPTVDLVIEREAGAAREADIARAKGRLATWLGPEGV